MVGFYSAVESSVCYEYKFVTHSSDSSQWTAMSDKQWIRQRVHYCHIDAIEMSSDWLKSDFIHTKLVKMVSFGIFKIHLPQWKNIWLCEYSKRKYIAKKILYYNKTFAQMIFKFKLVCINSQRFDRGTRRNRALPGVRRRQVRRRRVWWSPSPWPRWTTCICRAVWPIRRHCLLRDTNTDTLAIRNIRNMLEC